jgi:alpha-1,6-mannosyltransferase
MKGKKIFFAGLLLSTALCLELFNKQFQIGGWNGNVIFSSYNLRIGFLYVCLNILYVLWLISYIRKKTFFEQEGTINFFNTILPSLAFIFLSFISFPNTKTDISVYLHSGLMVLNDLNPYIVPAGDFESIFSNSWNQTSTYGPISQFLFLISSIWAKYNVLLSIYIFKTLCLVFHLLNILLIWRHLNSHFPRFKQLTLLYAINPILLFEQVSQAHIDIFLCTSIILIVININLGRFFRSFLFIWIGILIKTIPVIWVPLFATYLVSGRQWRTIAVCFLTSLVIICFSTFFFLGDFQAWLSLTNPGVSFRADRSIHLLSIIFYNQFPNYFPDFFSASRVYLGTKWVGYILYMLSYLFILVRLYFSGKFCSQNDAFFLTLSIGWATLFLFLFATPWNPSWYVSILIPIAVLLFPFTVSERIEISVFLKATLLFCFCSSTYYLLTLKGAPRLMLMIDCFIAAVPAIIFLLMVFNQRRARISSLFKVLRSG